MKRRVKEEAGVVLVVALLSMTLLVALGSTVLLATMTETAIAASYREAMQTFYAAEASVQYAMQELRGIPDWGALGEHVTSRTLNPDGTQNPEPSTSCASLNLTLATEEVAALQGIGEPVEWTLFSCGRFEDLLAGSSAGPPTYIVVWVADRSDELAGAGLENSGRDVLGILGRAYGPRGGHRTVEVTIVRSSSSSGERPVALEMLSWREWL